MQLLLPLLPVLVLLSNEAQGWEHSEHQHHSTTKWHHGHPKEEEKPHLCFGEANMEYMGRPIAHVPNVSSADICCLKCKETPSCRMWLWGTKRGFTQLTDGGDLVCTLRTADKKAKYIKKVSKSGVISGVPYAWDKPHSLFCFALMQPAGYERRLIDLHFEKRWGIFGCDEYEVISNQTIRVGPGVVTSIVNSNMHCDFGGEFGTALNTDLFLLVWQAVFNSKRFQFHDWTVKLDPDCVFFPERLRVMLAWHPDTYRGLYINNCKYGLHGPLEVLSNGAVFAWAGGYKQCQDHFEKVCSGPCLWGEDMFMDQCLNKVLKVKRVDDWNMLSEDHCDSDDWKECKNHRVAFHPFKTEKGFSQCMEDAEYGGLPVLF